MLILGCLGNTLIIIFFTRTRSGNIMRRHPYTLFFVHLACADLFACIMTPTYYLPQDISHGRWFFGRFLCEYTIFVPTGVAMYASCWILFGVIYERYRSLVHPFRAKIRRKHIHVFCLGAWILSFVFHLPYFMATSLDKDPETGVFVCVSSPSKLFTTNSSIVFYYTLRLVFQSFLPVLLMVYYYFQIHKAMNCSQRRRATLGVKTDISSRLRIQKHSIMRAIRVALIIFSFTIIMNNLGQLTRAVMKSYYQSTWESSFLLRSVVDFFIRFLAINNIVNCIIYAGSMSNFRKFVIDVLRCRYCYCWKPMKKLLTQTGFSEDEVVMAVLPKKATAYKKEEKV